MSILYLWACMSAIANILASWAPLVKSSAYSVIPRLQFPMNVQDHLAAMM